MKKKNVVLIVITVALLLITVIGATYAYFISYNPANIHNIEVEANIAGSNSVFTSIGNNIELNISAENMQQNNSDNVAAIDTKNLTISYLAGTNEELECEYDIYYKWSNTTDEYIITDDNEHEFTYLLSIEGNNVVPETNFVSSSNSNAQRVYSNLISNASESEPTTQIYTIETKYYNIDADQTHQANKNWKVEFYVDNVVCGEKINSSVYAYLYQNEGQSFYELVLRNTLNGDEENVTGLANDSSFNAKVTLLGNETNENNEVKTLDGTRTFVNFLGDISKRTDNLTMSIRSRIKSVNVETNIIPLSTNQWFSYMSNLNEIKGITNINTFRVKNMSNMFYSAQNLTNLDLSHFNTSRVENISNMFYSCSNIIDLNVSTWDTRNITDMYGTFQSLIYLRNLNLSNWNTINTRNMGFTFEFLKNLIDLNISNFNTSNVENMTYMFYDTRNIQSLNLSHFNTSKVKNMASMFGALGNITELDVSGFNTSNVTDMSRMFISSSLSNANLSHFNTSKVKNMASMLSYTSNIDTLNLSSWDVSNVEDMSSLFSQTGANIINVSSWNTSKVTSLYNTFSYLYNVNSLNLSGWNTSKVIDMTGLFSNSNKISTLDLSSWDVSNVEGMNNLFRNMTNLTSLNVSTWDTSNVSWMNNMFRDCSNITSLNLQSFTTIATYSTYLNATKNMFYNTTNLTSITATSSKWHADSVIDGKTITFVN